MKTNYTKEQLYLKAEKKVKEIKGFYVHLFIYAVTMPIIIYVNLEFSPGYHWFWYSLLGWSAGIFFHWFSVFGFAVFGLDNNWKKRKIEEIMNKYNDTN